MFQFAYDMWQTIGTIIRSTYWSIHPAMDIRTIYNNAQTYLIFHNEKYPIMKDVWQLVVTVTDHLISFYFPLIMLYFLYF